ncbi:uncharacterized protein LOC130748089 [Lotus japonicus]|uniref:uncharacterized protein LOC130748089 n=1 Tax=Lotus japonicus TaxID=34305 RepID=UPI002589006D|nr:uncharacterized protein LOC130748089 [Lotus japonicus]
MSSSVQESVFELEPEFLEANNMVLMSLMEETQEDEYYVDDRLVSMIQSLEAEISGPVLGQMYNMGHVDDQDFSRSFSGSDDMELISSSPFCEMNAWIPFGDEMEHEAMGYKAGNDINDFEMSYGVFWEQQHREVFFSQGPNDAVF